MYTESDSEMLRNVTGEPVTALGREIEVDEAFSDDDSSREIDPDIPIGSGTWPESSGNVAGVDTKQQVDESGLLEKGPGIFPAPWSSVNNCTAYYFKHT